MIARYDEDFYAGEPLATCNRVGAGSAIYVGTVGDPAFVEAIVGYAARQAGVTGLMQTPLGVEASARWRGDERLLFVLNDSNTAQQITLEGKALDLVTEQELEGTITIEPKQVMIFQPAN